MPITPTEALELRTLALRLQTDLARFGDRWARRQPRSRRPILNADVRLRLLIARFIRILETDRY
jgi:hypothetical protein